MLEKIEQERFIYPTQEIQSVKTVHPFNSGSVKNEMEYNDRIRLDRYMITELNTWLSRREIQCLTLIKKGYSAKAIAQILKISPRTVEAYTAALKSKLNKPSRLALAYDLDEFFPYLL